MLISFNVASAVEPSPFAKFVGKYKSLGCKCIGSGADKLSVNPCSIESIAIRAYQYLPAQKAWVLDELFTANYTLRPLDELALSPYLHTGEHVSFATHGDDSQAAVLFTASKGVSNYEIRKFNETNFQYVSGFKGVSGGGEKVDFQCYTMLQKQ